MQAVVNSLLTTYKTYGQGQKTALCLHGWGDTHATFAQLPVPSGYTLICPDLPGFGATQHPPQPWGVGDYATFAAEFLAKTGHKKLDAIIAHSNGGTIAIHGLANGQLAASHLVLMASAGIRNTKSQQLHRRLWQPIAKLGKAATLALPQHTRQSLRRKLYQAAGSDLLVAPGMEQTFKRIIEADIRPDAQRITTPTLLIYGSLDTATPPAYGHQLHDLIKSSQLSIIKDAGHFIHHDNPSETSQIINRFLAK